MADLRGRRAISFPFSDFCPPPGDTATHWSSLLAPLLHDDRPLTLRLFGSKPVPQSPEFETVGRALWHAADVTASEDERWEALGGSARRNIRKARNAGVELTARSDPQALAIFHRMHRHVRRHKYGMLAQAPSFFDALAEEFIDTGQLTVLLALIDGEPVAGIVLIAWQDTLYYKFNASTALAARPNDLLAWEAMNLASERGLHWFDFGLSDIDQEGLVRYKRKFATVEDEIVTMRHTPAGHRPSVPADAAASLGALTAMLTDERIPDDLLDRASEILYRNFA